MNTPKVLEKIGRMPVTSCNVRIYTSYKTAVLQANTPRSAVVMMSIHDDAQTRARAQAAGAVAFVEKSGALEVLLSTIRQIVEFTGRA